VSVERMDNVGIVVEDLDAAINFFTELGSDSKAECQSKVYRFCYIQGPEGMLVGLAEFLDPQTRRANPVRGAEC
jgi:hypothetical protein